MLTKRIQTHIEPSPVCNPRPLCATLCAKYTYKNIGLLNSITSPSGTVYSFGYDDFGNTTKISVGSQALIENMYIAERGLLDYSKYGNDVIIDYKFDILDRLTEKVYNGVTRVKFRGNTGDGSLW